MAKGVSSKLFYSCVALIASIVFSFTSLSTAGLYVLGSLGGSVSTTSYMTAFFGLANATSIPLALTFGGRFGRIAFAKWSLLLYILCTYSLGLSPNYPTLIVLRFLQGFFSGPLLILIPSMLTSLATNEQRLHFTRTISTVFIVVSILGNCAGGSIAYEWSWKWIFLIDGVIPTFLFFFFHHYLKGVSFPVHEKKFDHIGYLSYVIALWSLSLFLVFGQELDWLTSPLLRTCLVVFFISFPFFLFQSYFSENPILHFRLLKPKMIIALIELFILFAIYYGMMFLLGIWLRQYVNYTPNWISVILGAMLVSAFLIMLIMSHLRLSNSSFFLMAGLFFLALSSLLNMNFNTDVDLFHLAVARIIGGIGLALFLPPLLYKILSGAKEDLELHGLALFHITRTIGSGLGISLFSTIWIRRDVFYYLRLGGELTPFSENTRMVLAATKTFFFTPQMSQEGLEGALDRQSASLAINDCFYLMAILLIILLAFEFLRPLHKLLYPDKTAIF